MKNPVDIEVAQQRELEQQRLQSMAVGGLVGFRTLLYRKCCVSGRCLSRPWRRRC